MKREEELTVSVAIEKLSKMYAAEHCKLGEMLADDERDSIKTNWQGGKVNGIGVAIDTLSAIVATPKREMPEDHGLPPYPTGDVVGACVCGSWPGGPCLKCEVVPAHLPKLEEIESEIIDTLLANEPFVFDPATNFMHADDGGAPEHGIRYIPKPEATEGVEALAKRIVQGVCELQDIPDPDHPDTVIVTVQDLEAVIVNRTASTKATEGVDSQVHHLKPVVSQNKQIVEDKATEGGAHEKGLREAALAVLASWNDRMPVGEQERLMTMSGSDHQYWSPKASMVSSEAMAHLRAALTAKQSDGRVE